MTSFAPTFRSFRHATNECVHRSMNERRSQAAPDPEARLKIECECHRAECGAGFHVTRAAYESVRADGRRFLVVPEHQTAKESVVSETLAYWVIEKHGDEGTLANALDPR